MNFIKYIYLFLSYIDIFHILLLPPICKSCGKLLLNNEYIFCNNCKSKIEYIDKPDYCYKCGIFGNFKSYKSLCPICENKLNNNYKLLRTVVKYNNTIRNLVLNYKFNFDLENGDYIIKDIIKHYPNKYKEIKFDYITCIPTHWYRTLFRGFNQTEYISSKLGKILNIKFKGFIHKKKYTISQTKLTYTKRTNNINNSFALIKNHNLKGKNILIIEDVITTGSTINEYINILKDTQANLYILVYADARNIHTIMENNNGTKI